jgi:putative transposase
MPEIKYPCGSRRQWLRNAHEYYASGHRTERNTGVGGSGGKRQDVTPCVDQWFLDEVNIKIQGKQQYLWRAVDQDGEVLDILVQSRRNRKAAKRFFRKLLKAYCYVPRSITTDKLKSYAAAKNEVMVSVLHRQDKGLNNRAENSHQPTRERERRMRGFKSAKHAQQFLAIFSVIGTFFRVGRHLLRARNYRELMQRRFYDWREVVNTPAAA